MPFYEAYDSGVFCIDSGYIQNQYCAIYLIKEGNEVAIVETGTNRTLDRVLLVLSELGIQNNQVKYVIPTHIHLDHVGGASAMMNTFSQARLIIHPRGARHVIDPTKLIAGSKSVYGEALFERLYGEIQAIDEIRVDIAEDLSIFSLGQRELLFIDTPGHARHHFCIYDDKSKGMFSGDTFGISYPAMKRLHHGLMPSSTPVQFDAAALIKSVDRIISYHPDYVYLTHFGRLDEPAARAANLKKWIDDIVAACQTTPPADREGTDRLEQDLRKMAYDKLSEDADSIDQVMQVLSSDIRLNAQGLAIWWQNAHHA